MKNAIYNQEQLFEQFLSVNNLVWDKENKRKYEKFGDFYFPSDNIIIELKSLRETEISKILTRLRAPFVGSIPFTESFSSINNHLSDANTKATRASKSKEYENSLYIALLSIVNGYDLKIHELFSILQGAKLLNYLLCPHKGIFLDEKTRVYYVKDKVDDNDLLRRLDYIGILRKYGKFNNWKMELIEVPRSSRKTKVENTFLSKFTLVWHPIFC